MRYSVDPEDPGHANWIKRLGEGGPCRVLLDGVEQANVTTADEDQGLVVRAVLTDPNDPTSFKIDGDRIVEETVHGKVEVF